MPVGPNQDTRGSRDNAERRKLPDTSVSSTDQPNSIRSWGDVEGAGLVEIDQYRSGIVQQAEHSLRTAGGEQVEVRHATPEQRVSLTEVVVNVETRHHRGVSLARLV